MGIRQKNWVDDTMWEFGRPAFWLIHALGAGTLFFLGMRYAMRRVPVPIVMYRMLRSVLSR